MNTTTILPLHQQPPDILEQAALLLVEHFDEPSGWPTLELARQEVAEVLDEGFAFGLLEVTSNTLIGWIGGLPEYDGRVWELHPLVVRREFRKRGHGRVLVATFEAEAAQRGALTLTLGTDDDTGLTSLAHTNLYDDVPAHIANLHDLGGNHPFLFYRKLGYVVTGIMPDANGRGLPDIYMSKSVGS